MHGYFTGKVMAKLKNSIVISHGYTCYENWKSSCRWYSIRVLFREQRKGECARIALPDIVIGLFIKRYEFGLPV